MIKQNNIIFISLSLILFLSLIFIFDLRLSPDSKTFLNRSKSISSFSSIFTIREPLYIMSYIIFKFINLFDNFNFIFKLFNFISFLSIVFYSNKILKFYKIKLNNNYELLFFHLLFFLNFDMLQWTYYALTDLMLVALMLAAVYYLLEKNFYITILLLVFALLIKPQSIFVIFILSYVIFLKLNFRIIIFFYLYLMFLITVMILSYLFHIFEIKFHILNICYKIFFVKLINGNIIDDRINAEYFNIFSIFKIYLLRIFYFFSIFFEEYSLKHTIYKFIYFGILYAPLTILLKKKILFNKNFLNFTFGCFFIIAIFLILSFIDYDLRYRIYCYPFLIMISTYCFKKIYENKKLQ